MIKATSPIIIDIDGVIANSDARFALATGEDDKINWKKAFDPDAVALDTVIDGVTEIIWQLWEKRYYLVFLTSRPEAMREATLAWFTKLHTPNIGATFIFKPQSEQFTKTKEWKAREVDRIARDYEAQELFVVDDEPANIEEIVKYYHREDRDDFPVPLQTFHDLASLMCFLDATDTLIERLEGPATYQISRMKYYEYIHRDYEYATAYSLDQLRQALQKMFHDQIIQSGDQFTIDVYQGEHQLSRKSALHPDGSIDCSGPSLQPVLSCDFIRKNSGIEILSSDDEGSQKIYEEIKSVGENNA